MPRPRFVLLALATLLAISPIAARAHTPLGGLAVAVSPDGKTVVVGGDSRTLYVIDAATLEVKARVWAQTSIYALQFNKDGTKLIVEDTEPSLHVFDAKSWQREKEMRLGYLSAAPAVDLGAALEVKGQSATIKLLSLTDLAEKGAVAFEKGQKVAAFGLNAEGTRLAVFLDGVKDDSEPTAKSSDQPKDLKGAAADDWKQRNDGKTAMFFEFEVPSGKKLVERKLHYTTGTATVFYAGGAVHAVNYSNDNARVDAEGKVEMFETTNGFNYGLGVSADQKTLLSGGLRDGCRTTLDGLKPTKLQLDKLPGWPEYWKSFAIHSDGTAFGTTSGYRLARIKPDGTIEKTVPVH